VGQDVERIPTSAKIVALTFDAGANAAGLPSILATLRSTGVPATFFLTGRWTENYPAGVRQITAGGYRIGNHSTTHPMMTSISASAIAAELRTARAEIMAAGGPDPRPLFRFPYGDRDARTISVVNGEGYVAVRWTVDSLGWKGTSGGITRQAVIDRVVAAAQPGEIVLMHLGSNPDDASTLDADALPTIIAELRAQGYRFVTLDALL
jgi:peptidoglycan/xylan/chitin deacetylase (PgdA/CDA1 family)